MEIFSFRNGSLHFQDHNLRDILSQLYAPKSLLNIPPSNFVEEGWINFVHYFGASINIIVAFYTFMNFCYMVGALLFFVIDKLQLMKRYKIQQEKYPNAADYKKAMLNLFQNYILVIYPLIYFTYPLLSMLNFQMGLPLPTLFTWVWQMFFCIIVEDVVHYWLHRALHIPFLYKSIHKVHHHFAAPFGLVAAYAHPAEVIILGIPTFMGPLILRTHYFIFFSFILYRQIDAVVTHSGYDFPHPFDLLPFYGGTVSHDFHHKSFLFNYSSRFIFMDKLCGTYKESPSVGDKSKNI